MLAEVDQALRGSVKRKVDSQSKKQFIQKPPRKEIKDAIQTYKSWFNDLALMVFTCRRYLEPRSPFEVTKLHIVQIKALLSGLASRTAIRRDAQQDAEKGAVVFGDAEKLLAIVKSYVIEVKEHAKKHAKEHAKELVDMESLASKIFTTASKPAFKIFTPKKVEDSEYFSPQEFNFQDLNMIVKSQLDDEVLFAQKVQEVAENTVEMHMLAHNIISVCPTSEGRWSLVCLTASRTELLDRNAVVTDALTYINTAITKAFNTSAQQLLLFSNDFSFYAEIALNSALSGYQLDTSDLENKIMPISSTAPVRE